MGDLRPTYAEGSEEEEEIEEEDGTESDDDEVEDDTYEQPPPPRATPPPWEGACKREISLQTPSQEKTQSATH
jgi:hypothetical protein